MYEEFYHLSAKPFSLLPDADMLFPSTLHRRVMSLLEYGVVSEAGFIVVTGEIGAGKTTIVRRFLKDAGLNAAVGVINNPSVATGRLLDWVVMAFDLKPKKTDGSAAQYESFVAFLLEQYAQGRRTILVIDEAQNLPAEMLEELRMLSNVNNERDLLLQIVLVGQPELLDTLKRADLRQFVQRIAVHYHLAPLPVAETAAYVRYRLTRVGGSADLFDDLACAAVYRFTGGVPRLINLLCDQALVYAFAEGTALVTFDMVAEVAIDRAKSGLSAYQNVPASLSQSLLKKELQVIVDNIRSEADARMAAE